MNGWKSGEPWERGAGVGWARWPSRSVGKEKQGAGMLAPWVGKAKEGSGGRGWRIGP